MTTVAGTEIYTAYKIYTPYIYLHSMEPSVDIRKTCVKRKIDKQGYSLQ